MASFTKRTLHYILKTLIIVQASVTLTIHTANASDRIVVFAAASLKNALDDINDEWAKKTGKEVVVSYASSSALAKQIEAGAPADIFISADLDWMEYVRKTDSLRPETITNLLGNELVLAASNDNQENYKIDKSLNLPALLGNERLAVGNVSSVPAGKYAKESLENLGLWNGVKDKLAEADNVRAALLLVARGETPFAIVYKTDVASDSSVRAVGTFPQASYLQIIYPAAISKQSSNPDTNDYFDYLKNGKADVYFTQQGFTILRSQ